MTSNTEIVDAEKLALAYEYILLDIKLTRAILKKNEAVKIQDFQTAVIHREEEVVLRKLYFELGEKILNKGKEDERSVARDDQSGNKS